MCMCICVCVYMFVLCMYRCVSVSPSLRLYLLVPVPLDMGLLRVIVVQETGVVFAEDRDPIRLRICRRHIHEAKHIFMKTCTKIGNTS